MTLHASKLPEGDYGMYLRKSRADLEAESRGEGETLAKHKKMLMALGKRLNINITRIFQELVSGDRLSDRPEALAMLREVEDKNFKGILVVEVERLARGNTMDQGLVAQAFKTSSTLILTPGKIYDPNNEFDEEYFEFGLFMARREYATIKRRLIRGREISVEDGNYIGSRPPYGYKFVWDERGERFIVPHEEQEQVVKMIFDWYVNGIYEMQLNKEGVEEEVFIEMGAIKIARKLDSLGITTYRETTRWNFNVVLQILRNPVYVGRIQWKKLSRQKSSNPDKKYDYKKNDPTMMIDAKGKHDPIIDQGIFNRAAEKLRDNLSNPIKEGHSIVNPFAGILTCGKCNHAIILKKFPQRQGPGYSVACNNKYCDCKGANFDIVEEKIILALEIWLKNYKSSFNKRKPRENSTAQVLETLIRNLSGEMQQLQIQKNTLFDYLERKIYDEETFLERSKNLSERINDMGEKISKARKDLDLEKQSEKATKDVIPTIQESLKIYKRTTDVQKKNQLMKSILVKVAYKKEKHQSNDDFEIIITPRIR